MATSINASTADSSKIQNNNLPSVTIILQLILRLFGYIFRWRELLSLLIWTEISFDQIQRQQYQMARNYVTVCNENNTLRFDPHFNRKVSDYVVSAYLCYYQKLTNSIKSSKITSFSWFHSAHSKVHCTFRDVSHASYLSEFVLNIDKKTLQYK